MNQETLSFIAALRTQFGDAAVLSPKNAANVAASILFTTPDRSLSIIFKATPGDTVPIRATEIRRGPIEPAAVYHLAKADIQTHGQVRLALMNGFGSGEDVHLSTAIADAVEEIRKVSG